MYASFLGISSRSKACGMDIFHQPLRSRFFDSLSTSPHVIPVPEAVSQFDKTVIPGEPASLPRTRYGVGRDPESRNIAGNQSILDPGSHPAARDLAGMTNRDKASQAEI
jgi:hypothetical protein